MAWDEDDRHPLSGRLSEEFEVWKQGLDVSLTLIVQTWFLLINHRFQEEKLSSRILVFSHDQVYFKCHNCVWSENSRAEAEPLRSTLLGSSSSPDNISLKSEPWRIYQDYMWEYSGRQLTYDSDAINAMTGILNRISIAMKCPFLYGLPTASFDISVVFTATLFQRRPMFPSYSWAGWTGNVECEEPSPNYHDPNWDGENGEFDVESHTNDEYFAMMAKSSEKWLAQNTWIIWYERTPSGSPRLISSLDERNDRRVEIIHNKRKFFKRHVDGPFLQTAPKQDAPQLKVPPYSVLQFWTVIVVFTLEKPVGPLASTNRAN